MNCVNQNNNCFNCLSGLIFTYHQPYVSFINSNINNSQYQNSISGKIFRNQQICLNYTNQNSSYVNSLSGS